MMSYFVLSRRYAFVISMLLALSCAYLANFISIDGYRIVAVILAAPITYVLREFLFIHASRVEKIFEVIHLAAIEFKTLSY